MGCDMANALLAKKIECLLCVSAPCHKMKFFGYLLHNSTGAFFVWVKLKHRLVT